MEEHIQIVRQFQRAQNALAHHTRQRTVWNETKIKKLTNWITLTALANRIRNHSNNNNHLFFFSSINSAQCRLFPISQNYTKRNWARASSSSRTKKNKSWVLSDRAIEKICLIGRRSCDDMFLFLAQSQTDSLWHFLSLHFGVSFFFCFNFQRYALAIVWMNVDMCSLRLPTPKNIYIYIYMYLLQL